MVLVTAEDHCVVLHREPRPQGAELGTQLLVFEYFRQSASALW